MRWQTVLMLDMIRVFRIYPRRHADCQSEGHRAIRGGAAALQAHGGENRFADRAPRARVLREADDRAQAQARRRDQAPSQAPALAAPSAADVLINPGEG